MATVSIHPDLQLCGLMLTDTSLHTTYTLTKDTAWLLRRLMRDGRVEYMVASAAHHYGITQDEARASAYAVLGYLDRIGGVRIHAHTGLALLLVAMKWRSRYVPGAWGFTCAMIRAYGLIIIGLTAILYALLLLYPGSDVLWTALPVAVFMSCILHEAGHVAVVWVYRLPAVLLARTGYAAVAYVRPRRKQARNIAAAGPCFAALPYLIVAGVVSVPSVRWLALSTAAVHLASLLPWSADGKTIWRST